MRFVGNPDTFNGKCQLMDTEQQIAELRYYTGTFLQNNAMVAK